MSNALVWLPREGVTERVTQRSVLTVSDKCAGDGDLMTSAGGGEVW